MAPRRIPIPFIGPSNKAASGAQQSGRTVNMYPEVNDADAKAVIALKHVPGFFRWLDASDDGVHTNALPASAVVRGMHIMMGRLFMVIGAAICEIYPTNSFTVLAHLSTTRNKVGMSDNNSKLIIGDGTGFWVLDLDTLVLTQVLNDDEEPILGWNSLYINSQTLYFERDSSTYHYSEVNDPTTVLGLSFFSAEASPDFTINAHRLGDQIIILGTDSTEGHYNSASDPDNPFQRIDGAVLEYGCVGRWANCRFDNRIAMVGRNKEGQGKVVLVSGANGAEQIISSPAVEKCLEKVSFAFHDVTDRIVMFSQEDAGHRFLFLNIPESPATVNNPFQPAMTWVYDAATQLWHERAYMNPDTGKFERILSDFHVLWRGRHYTGARDAPHLYEMSLDYYRENTLPLVKMRESAGPLNFQGRRGTVHKLGIEMETGVGRDAGVQGSDPQIILQYSWDNGHTWSDEIFRSIGRIGEYDKRVEFGPCGSGYNFNIRVICSEPVRLTFTGAWADVTVH